MWLVEPVAVKCECRGLGLYSNVGCENQAGSPIYCILMIYSLVKLSWFAVEGAAAGIDADMGSCTAASMLRVGRGVAVGEMRIPHFRHLTLICCLRITSQWAKAVSYV